MCSSEDGVDGDEIEWRGCRRLASCFFFFSSRRRHTRCSRDWSSDVCSSDLSARVDWEGTFIDPNGPNILIDLPPAIKNFPDYVASGFDPNSQAAQNIVAAGYPPDIVLSPTLLGSLWGNYWNQFWEVTQCQWQKRFDPDWQTYFDGLNDVTGTGGYDYFARVALDPSIAAQVGAVATT